MVMCGIFMSSILENGQFCVNTFFPTQVVKKLATITNVPLYEPVCICNGPDAKEQAIKIAWLLEFDRNNKIH